MQANCIAILLLYRIRYPLYFKKLLFTAVKEVLVNLPNGVTAEDVAFFIGSVIGRKGLMKGAPDISLGIILRTATRIGSVITLTRLPSITLKAVKEAAEKHSGELQKILAEAGLDISREESKVLLEQVLKGP